MKRICRVLAAADAPVQRPTGSSSGSSSSPGGRAPAGTVVTASSVTVVTMSSKNMKQGSVRGSHSPKEGERKSSEPEPAETKTALLTPSSADLDASKNGSHAPSAATIAVEDDVGGTTPDGARTRKLAHIKKRVSQEFTDSTRCQKALKCLIHTVGATMPYVAILMGAIYLDDCPAQRMIPVHLIVAGVTASLMHLSTSIDVYRKLPYLKQEKKPAIYTLVSLFLTVWMILGCVWTFGIFTPVTDPGEMYNLQYNSFGMGYCKKPIYWFAFVFNLVSLISFLGGWILCCCMCTVLCNVGILTCLCSDSDDDEDNGPVNV